MSSQNSYDADMQELKRLNAKFIHNFVTNDTAAHAKLLHDGFLYISSNGKYVNRKDYLIDWAHGFDGIKYWDYRDERITIFGNMALVHAQNKFVMMKEEKEITGFAMYTDTYIKERGEWKCVQAQICSVTPENYAPDSTIVRKYE